MNHGSLRDVTACAFPNVPQDASGWILPGVHARQQAENGADWITIGAADTGNGMTPEQIARLFQEFPQASSATVRKYGGTGLGLAICKRFCQMTGGDIAVGSEPACGSTFTIRLPRIVELQAVEGAHVQTAKANRRVRP
jgi:signal transduction histidine kinase